MKKFIYFLSAVLLCIGLTTTSIAAEKQEMKGQGGQGIKGMTKEQLIKLAMSAAPAQISKDATIMIPGEDGKLVEAKKGSNGFTCMPDLSGMPKPDPICADAAAMQWINDLMNNAPKPTNTAPGIAYMAEGGSHFEKDGKILMKNEPGAKEVQEPPHWMVFWPFDSKASGIPAMPNKLGTYVMFDGTPYAHLMVYQDPKNLK